MRLPHHRAYVVHLGLTALASAGFIFINLLTQGSDFWAIWPIWGLLILLGAHTGAASLRGHRLLGAWLGGGGVIILGLIAIDLSQPGTGWWYWPAGVWVVLSALLIGLSVDLLSSIPTQGDPRLDEDESLPPVARS